MRTPGKETSEWQVTLAVLLGGAGAFVVGLALLALLPPYVGLTIAGLGAVLIVSSSRDYVGSRSDTKAAAAASNRPVYAPADSIRLKGK